MGPKLRQQVCRRISLYGISFRLYLAHASVLQPCNPTEIQNFETPLWSARLVKSDLPSVRQFSNLLYTTPLIRYFESEIIGTFLVYSTVDSKTPIDNGTAVPQSVSHQCTSPRPQLSPSQQFVRKGQSSQGRTLPFRGSRTKRNTLSNRGLELAGVVR